MKIKAMDRAVEAELIRRAQYGGSDALLLREAEQAKSALLEQHKNALWKIVRKIRSRGETPDDLYQWAVVYFLISLGKYDLSRKTRLSTWCYEYVKKRMWYVATRSGIIHLPQGAKKCDPKAYDIVMGSKTVSISHFMSIPSEARGGAGGDTISHEIRPTMPESLDASEQLELFNWAVAKLPPHLRQVIEWRRHGMIYDSIGLRLTLTRERVRQMCLEAEEAIRRLLVSRRNAGLVKVYQAIKAS